MMKFVCDIGQEGVRILRCFGYDGQVEIPEKIHGIEVSELGAYVFADTVRRRKEGRKYLAQIKEEKEQEEKVQEVEEQGVKEQKGKEQEEKVQKRKEQQANEEIWEWEECSEALLDWEVLEDGMPVIKAQELRSVVLSKGVKKIGAYAFYLCEKLEKLTLYSTVLDLGAGLFTGCLGVRELDIWMIQGKKSCLKEILAELRQTLRVNVFDTKGNTLSRLIFPEYFEESIENTPARILTLEVHGCGHRYRNAFQGTELQYSVYDKLFAHIQVQEAAELAAELALGRLRFPLQLGKERERVYEEYLAAHGKEIVKLAFGKPEEMEEILTFAGEAKWCTKKCMEDMLSEARQRGNPLVAGMLMEFEHRQRKNKTGSTQEGVRAEENGRRKRFVL